MTLKKKHKLSLDKFINYALYDKDIGYYINANIIFANSRSTNKNVISS